MKSKKHPLHGLIYVILAIAVIVVIVNHFRIADFRVIEPGTLYVSSQPRGMDYSRLFYRYHIAAIVNIRLRQEHSEDNWHGEEVTWAKNNGVNYIEMPVEKKHYLPDGEMQKRFLEIMTDKSNLPALLHGGGGDDKRVAMLVAVWLRKNQRRTTEETFKMVKSIIDDRPLTAEENDFVNSLEDRS